MSRLEPGKVGKLGYLLALLGIFLVISPIMDFFYGSVTAWDSLLLLGIILVGIGHMLARKDPKVKNAWWKILAWSSVKPRERVAQTLVVAGYLWSSITILNLRSSWFIFTTSSWILACAGVAAVIIGWGLMLTERESSTKPA